MKTSIKKMKLSDLIPTEDNPRQIKKEDFERLKKSLESFPKMLDIREIVVDENNRILGGHQRVKALIANGKTEVNVKVVEGLSEEEKREFVIRDNIQNGEWDFDILANGWSDLDLQDWGIDLPVADIEEEIIDDEVPEPPAEPKSKLGEIYQLGEHRLMCGDSTDAEQVAKLMDGAVADIAFTSPPYNAGQTATETHMGKTSKYENDSDNKSQEEYRQFLDNYLRICFTYAKYTFMNVQSLANNKRALIGVMYDNMDFFADTIIWDKQNAQPAMANNVLNSRFEYVHCFSNEATRAIGCVDFRGTHDNVLSLQAQHKNEFSDIHNATFSLDFAVWFVKNFAKDSVFDSFGGTGTTLIACEQLGRKCYMMELDPHYVDVIIERWENLTGKKAERIQ